MPLEVVCNNHSPAPIYLPRIVVLGVHLLLLVLAALHICWDMCVYCGAWSAPVFAPPLVICVGYVKWGAW